MDRHADDVTIVSLRADHLLEVMAIERQSFGRFAWTRQQSFLKYAGTGEGFVLVEKKTGVIGFALLTETSDQASLDKMAISEQHRGRGLGKFLLLWILARSRRRSIFHVVLHVRGSNAPAIKLYTSSGFKQTAREEEGYTTHHPQELERVKIAMEILLT